MDNRLRVLQTHFLTFLPKKNTSRCPSYPSYDSYQHHLQLFLDLVTFISKPSKLTARGLDPILVSQLGDLEYPGVTEVGSTNANLKGISGDGEIGEDLSELPFFLVDLIQANDIHRYSSWDKKGTSGREFLGGLTLTPAEGGTPLVGHKVWCQQITQ